VAHVDQGAACGLDEPAADALSDRVWQSVEGSVRPEEYTCLHLEDVFGWEGGRPEVDGNGGISREERRQRLHALLQVRWVGISWREVGGRGTLPELHQSWGPQGRH